MLLQKRQQPSQFGFTAMVRSVAERVLENRIRKTKVHTKPSTVAHELGFMLSVLVTGHWYASGSPLLATRYDYGQDCFNREYQRRDAIAYIRMLAERGIDCSVAIPVFLTHLERETSFIVLNNIIEAVRVLASRGADLSPLVPFLEKQAANERSRFYECAPDLLDLLNTREHILEAQASYRTQMKQRLTSLADEFEATWSMPLPFMTLITDATTSCRFVRRGRNPFEVDQISDFTGYNFPETLVAATAERHMFYGRVILWRTSLEDPHFDAILFHEFAHLLRSPGKCFDKMEARLSKSCSNKSQITYLIRILVEGFADFCSQLTAEIPVPRCESQKKLEAVLDEAKNGKGWAYIAKSDKYTTHVYDIGLNFFSQAHAIIKCSPLGYVYLLSRTPPTPEELLSHDGGKRWAERVM